MRVLVIGAGAVGVVLTQALERQKGNEVTYFVRKGRRADLVRHKILELRQEKLTVRERPTVIEAGMPLPAVDTVILAVRADQVDAALDVVGELPAPALDHVRIASASAGLDDLAIIKRRFPGRACAQILPMFMAYFEDDVLKWMAPPLVPSFVIDDGDAASHAFAEELAAAFKAGGLAARAAGPIGSTRDVAMAGGIPVLAVFELAGWDFAALSSHNELRQLAASSAREALAALVPAGFAFAALGTQPIVQVLLSAAPHLPANVLTMWRVHGPKIAAQTRQLLALIITRVEGLGRPATHLRDLQQRLETAS